MIYDPQITLRDARRLYFELSGFPVDGGYEERLIKVRVWRIPIWLPNTKGRRRAVRLHDLHHVLTEYPTTWRGEAEISAWEIASGGLHGFYAGWVLDLMNVAQGLVINPRGVYRAFLRGRRNSNLYDLEFSEELLTHRVGEVRERLRLHHQLTPATVTDRAAFIGWAFASVATYIAGVLSTPLIMLAVGFLLLFRLDAMKSPLCD